MGGLLRTLDSEIELYETDYIFVSSGYPPRVEGRMDQFFFLRSQLPGLTGFVSAPENITKSNEHSVNECLDDLAFHILTAFIKLTQ